MNQRMVTTTIAVALTAAMLAGCDQRDQTDAKRIANDTAATLDQKARDAGGEVAKGMDQAKVIAAVAASQVGNKIDDAMITTNVKAQLANDAGLNPLKISVTTENGRVSLKGTAGDAAARGRATSIVQQVKGVTGVDNQLELQPG